MLAGKDTRYTMIDVAGVVTELALNRHSARPPTDSFIPSFKVAQTLGHSIAARQYRASWTQLLPIPQAIQPSRLSSHCVQSILHIPTPSLLLLPLLLLLVLLLGFTCRQGVVQGGVHTPVAVAVHMYGTRYLHTAGAKARVSMTASMCQ
jgi:hypothetical protein